jgi:hypothetical protein
MTDYISSKEKAAMGLALIKEAILEHLTEHPDGLHNSDFARDLGLHSEHEGGQPDYLTYSVLGLLMTERRVTKVKGGARPHYVRIS